jgi:hypothetical protein
MPNATKVLDLVKELPFKDAHASLGKFGPPLNKQASLKLGQQI